MNKRKNIRNFCIIAHIDHGKSTLCDRFLELTGQIKKGQTIERVLDSNPISQERGITIKLAPVTMQLEKDGTTILLNMIDTPGHVDFSYEVSRSLAACEGAVLVVDASQGIQAQTLSYWRQAKKQGLKIITAINKIDLPTARVEEVRKNIIENLNINPADIYEISAKSSVGVEVLLSALIEKIPPPRENTIDRLQALVFDSFYHPFKGVIVYLRIVSGSFDDKNLDDLMFVNSGQKISGLEIGIFTPELKQKTGLTEGEVGYLATGLKDITKAQVGDTLTKGSDPALPLQGYKNPQSMVYLNFFPTDPKEYVSLRRAVLKLKLNDASLNFSSVYSEALGKGLRCGFLGLLHAEVIQERLENEFNIELIATQPSVVYQIKQNDKKELVYGANDLPPGKNEVFEPVVRAVIFTPEKYIGNVFKLCEERRGNFVDMQHFTIQTRLTYKLPLAEIIVNFFDQLKSASSGFASLDYEFIGYEKLSAVRLDILIHGKRIHALSQIVPEKQAYETGRNILKRLKDIIPRQMFEFSLQSAIGGKIIASEKMSAFRKDVTAKLYGGDQTRKDKLLKKQSKGKKRMKKIGRVELPQEAFMAVLKRS